MESSNPLIDISFYTHDISACCCIVTVRRLRGGGEREKLHRIGSLICHETRNYLMNRGSGLSQKLEITRSVANKFSHAVSGATSPNPSASVLREVSAHNFL